jgi:hypothetical protein
MLGMSPGEVRLLLFAHLSFDKDSGKVCPPSYPAQILDTITIHVRLS